MLLNPAPPQDSFTGQAVSLEQVLLARDARAARQKDLLRRFGGCLVCLTVNLPGPVKRCPAGDRIFSYGRLALYGALPVCYGQVHEGAAGCEGYFIVRQDAAAVKARTCALEEEHPLGRLWDMDVLAPGGRPVSRQALGMPPRRCLLCGREAALCARSRAHPVDELLAEMGRRLSAWEAAQ